MKRVYKINRKSYAKLKRNIDDYSRPYINVYGEECMINPNTGKSIIPSYELLKKHNIKITISPTQIRVVDGEYVCYNIQRFLYKLDDVVDYSKIETLFVINALADGYYNIRCKIKGDD